MTGLARCACVDASQRKRAGSVRKQALGQTGGGDARWSWPLISTRTHVETAKALKRA
jgi:hypothetical protein